MQCPECKHIPLAGTEPDPSRCPKCGMFYLKAVEMRRANEQLAKQQAASEAASAATVAAELAAAESAAPEAEAAAAQEASMATVKDSVSQNVRDALIEYRGAQPVVVLDINMSFSSMVVFMVKWVLASIPALILLFLIFFIPLMLFGGLGLIGK